MPFELFFPGNEEEYGSYRDLMGEDDVYEVIREEVKKVVSDQGSDAYEPLFENGIPDLPANWEDLSEEKQMELTLDAHERGIEHATSVLSPPIHSDLWLRFPVKTDRQIGDALMTDDIADDDGVTHSTLPDGTRVALREYQD